MVTTGSSWPPSTDECRLTMLGCVSEVMLLAGKAHCVPVYISGRLDMFGLDGEGEEGDDDGQLVEHGCCGSGETGRDVVTVVVFFS